MDREIKFRGRSYDGIWMFGYLMPAAISAFSAHQRVMLALKV